MNISLKHQKLYDLIEQGMERLNLPEEPRLLYDPLRYTLGQSGKRVRPYFTLIGCGMCGGDVEESVPAALSIELLHNFTPIHDDIMDAADTRRGHPSVFKKWDSSTAILSGDVMYALAFEQLKYYAEEDRYTKRQYADLMDIFLQSTKTVCEGQANDLEFGRREDVDIDQYLDMIQDKTGALISGAFMLGGAVAGADSRVRENLRDLGRAAGTAFQMQDDLLDLFADPSKFGKKVGGDIIEGKKTYLSILALQKSSERQREELENTIGKPGITDEQIERVIAIYKELGVVEETRARIGHYYSKANEILERFPASEYKQELLNYILKLKNREF